MIKLVRVNSDYIKKLREADQNVQINSAEMNKQTKPFLGVLFNVGYIEYFVPLSSPKEKHIKMNDSADFHKVYARNGKLRAVLNFNNMVPVIPTLYEEININADKDKFVLRDEYEFFLRHTAVLQRKAKAYYDMFCNNRLSPAQRKRTCDFLALERVLIDILKNENSVNSARYQASRSKKSSDEGKSK